MFNPNAPKTPSAYERIEGVLASITPNPRDFADKVYLAKEVGQDLGLLKDFKNSSDYEVGEERSDAKLLEKTFIDSVELGDWFYETESYADDEDCKEIISCPTSEVDDTFNHIDVICMINNETTGHEDMPFAIDLTYNTDNEKMRKKFEWKHVYGRKNNLGEDVSEFGSSFISKDRFGRDTVKTTPLPLKFRRGLKIPGFASAKYFEDKNHPEDAARLKKGRIDVMPRFIVGYSPDIAETLANGRPNSAYKAQYGQESYDKKRAEYETAEKRAKWCTLFECSEQASSIRQMMDNLSPEDTKYMQPEELATARKQIAIMDEYFKKAISVAARHAKEDPREKAAAEYAGRDIVCENIRLQSDFYRYQKSSA